MIKGQVKWFDTAKGFGFILSDEVEGDILLHANVLRNFGRSSVAEGAPITIKIQATERGHQASEIFEIGIPAPDENEIDGALETNVPHVDPSVSLQPARVKWFDKSKGFGFANLFDDDRDVFLHVEIMRHYGLSDLIAGEAISVRVIQGPRGLLAGEVRSWDQILIEKDREA